MGTTITTTPAPLAVPSAFLGHPLLVDQAMTVGHATSAGAARRDAVVGAWAGVGHVVGIDGSRIKNSARGVLPRGRPV